MRPLVRRALVRGAGAALAMPFIPRLGHAAEVTWRLGHVAPTATVLHEHLLEAADAIKKRSDGKMELKIIPEGQAGIQSGLLAQVRNGGMEMTLVSGVQLAPTMPISGIPSAAFLFADHKAVWQAMDGELGELLRTQISSLLGIQVMEKIWDFGFRHITTNDRAITKAGDLAGLKIRSQIDEDQMDMLRALDAVPVAITLPYLRTALQHRQIDGQDSTLPVVQYARLNEVQSYCALTSHAWDGQWICVNDAAWKKLPERMQRIVANTMNGVAPRQREASATFERNVRENLAKAGLKFTDVDKASFRDRLRQKGYYAGVKAKIGDPAWALVQKISGVAA